MMKKLTFCAAAFSAFLLVGCGEKAPEMVPSSEASSAPETSSAPEDSRTIKPREPKPLSFAGLESNGAVMVRDKEGGVKSIDLGTLCDAGVFFVLAEEPEALRSVRVVRGRKYLDDELAASLAACPRLTELLWTEAVASDQALRTLAACGELKKLRLTGLKTTPETAAILASLPALADLDLSESTLTDADLTALCAAPKLTKLNLYRTQISDTGVENLRPLADRLESLNLDATLLTDAGVPALGAFGKLTFLHLGRTAITDAALEGLASLKTLKKLHVTRTGVTPDGAKQLADALPDTEIVSVPEIEK